MVGEMWVVLWPERRWFGMRNCAYAFESRDDRTRTRLPRQNDLSITYRHGSIWLGDKSLESYCLFLGHRPGDFSLLSCVYNVEMRLLKYSFSSMTIGHRLAGLKSGFRVRVTLVCLLAAFSASGLWIVRWDHEKVQTRRSMVVSSHIRSK